MADRKKAASVDYLVDENGAALDVPDGSTVRPARTDEESVGSTGPTNWWGYGLIALAAIALVLVLTQVFSGSPGTDVQSGTPVAEPDVTTPVV
jgi:hypothetical protein